MAPAIGTYDIEYKYSPLRKGIEKDALLKVRGQKEVNIVYSVIILRHFGQLILKKYKDNIVKLDFKALYFNDDNFGQQAFPHT
ncbi:hypothetical protein TrispH2_011499 [Trichoplax sp. H2]|nr:hypothetical protein TrispH2_011499 [Trichoplax sp. H2]|eukprot:RDD36599.1 hypothetical protein TrispH2_011499 [Trichoplax sp. H2]